MALFKKSRKKAVAYYRHSAEDKQEESVPIQREQVQAFAAKHDIEIIHEEADEGESGLTANRPSFRKLFAEWVLNQQASDYEYVLVLNVSRWGRFENQNEPAFYEFQCNQQGKKVIYTDNGFPREEHSVMDSVLVALQRAGAFEYSKKLSTDVFRGAVRTVQKGFSAGGHASYGLARMMLDATGVPVGILKKGEHKAIDNYHVTFVPANDGTTETVREIFRHFVVDRWGHSRIANVLNAHGFTSPGGKIWTPAGVLRILRNHAYAGTLVYNKTGGKLKRPRRKNLERDWIVCINAFPAIIEPDIFEQAHERLRLLFPFFSRGRVGAIVRAKRLYLESFVDFLVSEGFSTEEARGAVGKMPFTFAVSGKGVDGHEQWCFRLPETAIQAEHVLAVAMSVDEKNEDGIFLIPTQEFKIGDYRLLTHKESAYSLAGLSENELKEKMLAVVKKL